MTKEGSVYEWPRNSEEEGVLEAGRTSVDGEGGILRGTARGRPSCPWWCAELLGCVGWVGEKRAEFRRGEGRRTIVEGLE